MKSFAKLLAVASRFPNPSHTRSITKVLALGAVLAATAPFALADQVSVGNGTGGGVSYNATTLTFIAPFTLTGGTGIFSVFNSGTNTITFAPGPLDDAYDGTLPAAQEILTISNLSSSNVTTTDSFYLTSLMAINPAGNTYTDPNSGELGLGISGSGYVNGSNISGNEAASFTITSQDEDAAGTTVSFSAGATTLAPTPEPSSLLLLGTGLLGSAGMLYRRSRLGSAV